MNERTGKAPRSVLVILLCVLNLSTLYISGQENINMSLYSLLCRAYIVVIYGAFIYSLYATGGVIYNTRTFLLILALSASTVISYIVNPSGSVYDWFVLAACYLEIPILYFILDSFDADILNSNIMKIYGILLTLLFAMKAFQNPIYDSYTEALTMGYTNSNRTAIYLLEAASFITIQISISKSKIWKAAFTAALGVLTAITVLTQSRTCVLCAILLWVIVFFQNHIFVIIKTKFLSFITVFPLLFVAIYLTTYDSDFMVNTVIYGKSLASGRQYIYQECLEALEGNWLFGNYAYCQFNNMHNFLLTILATCGIVGVVIYLVFFRTSMGDILEYQCSEKVPQIAFMCLLVLYISASSEAGLFNSGMIYSGQFFLVLMYTKYDAVKYIEEYDDDKNRYN